LEYAERYTGAPLRVNRRRMMKKKKKKKKKKKI
jgi:hypothetical protein